MTEICVYWPKPGPDPRTDYGAECFYSRDERVIVLAELIAEQRLTKPTREWPGACEGYDTLYIVPDHRNYLTLQRAGVIDAIEKTDY